jgi:hypothetical protein
VNFDVQARIAVYAHIAKHATLPSSQDVAGALSCGVEETRAAFARLAQAHTLVLQEDGEILMANPFSAVPTAFVAEVGGPSWWGNCILDAPGIVVLFGPSGRVLTSCGCCNFRMEMRIESGALRDVSGIAHFAVPAKHWWDNIVFT